MRLTRRYRFSASHRLHSGQLSGEENRQLYGKCNNPFGHGHDYILEVTVSGPLDALSGRVVNVNELDELVRTEVLGPFDHANLNAQAAAFAGQPPTSENVALEILGRLRRRWSEAIRGAAPVLEKIKLQETRRNIFEVSSSENED